MNTKSLLSTTILAASCFLVSPVMAEEADVCAEDGLTGAAYGLCNAYCNAMKCQLLNDNDDNTNPHANQTACEKVEANFISRAGEEVSLPCESQVECPAISTWINGSGGCGIEDTEACPIERCVDNGSVVIADVTEQVNGTLYVKRYAISPLNYTVLSSVNPPGDIVSYESTPEERNACRVYLQNLAPVQCTFTPE